MQAILLFLLLTSALICATITTTSKDAKELKIDGNPMAIKNNINDLHDLSMAIHNRDYPGMVEVLSRNVDLFGFTMVELFVEDKENIKEGKIDEELLRQITDLIGLFRNYVKVPEIIAAILDRDAVLLRLAQFTNLATYQSVFVGMARTIKDAKIQEAYMCQGAFHIASYECTLWRVRNFLSLINVLDESLQRATVETLLIYVLEGGDEKVIQECAINPVIDIEFLEELLETAKKEQVKSLLRAIIVMKTIQSF